ncbi:hypothetical protein [Actinoplanes siamensis]|uniref:Uncharacterized protein n=1 Tax=Actinoplanes siamensis TaxID=1223317 RepID=A0A919N428_9ACTN|nr:hypothetical protein [Actinoplanes siamensis]GIF04005.1 hypothetical protein Asi03nite_15430 [Actinoplanes siamensis]
MIRGRTGLLVAAMAVTAMAGCDGSAVGRAGAGRPLTPVSESLPPPSREVLAPDAPVRSVLPGDEMAEPEPSPPGERSPASGRPARTRQPRVTDRSDLPDRRDERGRRKRPGLAATSTRSARQAHPKPSAEPIVPDPATEPAAPAAPAAPDETAEGS